MPPRILLLAALLAGCAGAAPPAPVPDAERPAETCLLGSTRTSVGEAGSGRTALVAAAASADTGLFAARRASTPIGLDCAGRPVPRVARSWSASHGGRSWTLVVPSAATLAGVWRGVAEAGSALRLAGVTSYVPIDDSRLVVSFAAPYAAVPGVFADPALGAVAAADADSSASGGSRWRRMLPPPADLRDAVDQSVDLVVTADPAVADYAVRRGGYAAEALPWSRSYVLLVPGGDVVAVPDSAGFRDALARDAVGTWARGAAGARWWEAAVCDRPAPAAASPTAALVYPASDPVARSLAERIVATLPGFGVTRGVAEGQLAAAISRGLGTAFVVPLPLVPLVPCREIASWPEKSRVLPLVDTRRMALVRAGVGPLRVDHDGGLVLETP